MRTRRIAVLIDGAFFIKRLPKLLEEGFWNTPEAVAKTAYRLCKRHVRKLIGERGDQRESCWLDHVYRLFYYDAVPFEGMAHHPLTNHQIDFARTDNAQFRHALFEELRRQRKFALRLGKVTNLDGWSIHDEKITKRILRTKEFVHLLEHALTDAEARPEVALNDIASLRKIIQAWKDLSADDVRLGLRQRGVDMRIGIDIATLTLKKQVDTIILVTGDSDFVPAAKVARREGVEFLLDPLSQSISDDLHEHVDGVMTVFRPQKLHGHSSRLQDENTTYGACAPSVVQLHNP